MTTTSAPTTTISVSAGTDQVTLINMFTVDPTLVQVQSIHHSGRA